MFIDKILRFRKPVSINRKPLNAIVKPRIKSPSTGASAVENIFSFQSLLGRNALVVGRQMEMLNIFIGYEQANRYVIYDAESSSPVGFIMETNKTILGEITRQLFRTRRSFKADVLDLNGNLMIRIERPFQWWLNSRMKVYHQSNHPDDPELLGEVHQRFHLLRRQYSLFKASSNDQLIQFGDINAPILSWDFEIEDEDHQVLASVNKNFIGLGRELFTDTSHYVIRFNPSSGSYQQLSMKERAVTLACAISIDFDYFSRLSENRGGFLRWLPFVGIFGSNDS